MLINVPKKTHKTSAFPRKQFR